MKWGGGGIPWPSNRLRAVYLFYTHIKYQHNVYVRVPSTYFMLQNCTLSLTPHTQGEYPTLTRILVKKRVKFFVYVHKNVINLGFSAFLRSSLTQKAYNFMKALGQGPAAQYGGRGGPASAHAPSCRCLSYNPCLKGNILEDAHDSFYVVHPAPSYVLLL